MTKVFDCIIIGGGPSGLAAGNILTKAGVDFLIIDKGDYLYKRKQEIPRDIVTGIGGGGLYSDGKVSFYPSGSNLYKLNNILLKKSYLHLTELFNTFSIQIPEFESKWLDQSISEANESKQTVENKHYESHVLSQDELYRVGFFLYDQIGKENFLIEHSVTKIKHEGNIFHIELVSSSNTNKKIRTRNIIFCGGKFGALNLKSYFEELIFIFKKFEFGIRVETNHEIFDFKEIKQTDLKLLMRDDQNEGIEFRTFCFCRNGYIVHGKFEDIDSFNGVSNKPEHSKTNFGLNLRIKDESVFNSHKDELLKLKEYESIIKQKIKDFLSLKNDYWSQDIYSLFQKCLTKHFPKVCQSNAEVTGPSFEYFGYYPKLNDELKIENKNFWICGDATGDFRGLMPSLTSGYLAALSYIEKDNREKESLYDLIRLKVSPTSKIKTIFTAQSKKFFYAKDVICEFVFKEGHIPVNPFQVFGYFLNDRVDRVLVRNGNNELISRCDELWVFGPIADGVLFEISRAAQLKLPIKFFTVGTITDEIVEITELSKLIFEPEVHAKIGKENLIKFISRTYGSEDASNVQLKLNFDDILPK